MNQTPITWEQRCELIAKSVLDQFPPNTNYAGTIIIGDFRVRTRFKGPTSMSIEFNAPDRHYTLHGKWQEDGSFFLNEIVTNTSGAKFRTGSMFRSEIDSAGGRELLRNLELIITPEV